MKRGRRLLLGGLAGFVGTTMASVGGQQAQPPAGGAYTAAQAQAGQAAYARQCAGCHSADLRGSGDAPAVAGPDFIAKWGSRAVNELFTYVVQSMPPTNPGSLGEAGTLEVTAYLLQINGALAGQQPLTATRFDADERRCSDSLLRRHPGRRQAGEARRRWCWAQAPPPARSAVGHQRIEA